MDASRTSKLHVTATPFGLLYPVSTRGRSFTPCHPRPLFALSLPLSVHTPVALVLMSLHNHNNLNKFGPQLSILLRFPFLIFLILLVPSSLFPSFSSFIAPSTFASNFLSYSFGSSSPIFSSPSFSSSLFFSFSFSFSFSEPSQKQY